MLAVGASAYVIVYFIIVAARLTYPFELEWMEGGAVLHVDRVLRGQPLYAQPSLDFTAFIYTPLYFYVSALFASVLGIGFVPLRLVSFLSSIGCLIFIFLIVRRRTGAMLPALLSCCLFAAAFRVTGAWLDISRVDSLFMCLLLAALYAFWSPSRLARTVVAAVLLFLAFFSKQTAFVAGAGLMAAAFLRRQGSERLMLPVLSGLLLAASTTAMNAVTDGWYGYYVFDLPAQHPIASRNLVEFWTHDLIANFPVAIVMSIAIVMNVRRKWWATQGLEDASILAGLVTASYLSRLHSGGYDNVLMPAVAGLSIFFGIGFAHIKARWNLDSCGKAALYVMAGLQFLLLTYSPYAQIPSAADRKAGEALLARISMLNGEVYWPEHPWYLRMIGKSSQAQAMAVSDVIRANRSLSQAEFLYLDLALAVEEGAYAAFVTDSERFALRPAHFAERYRAVDMNLTGRNFVPVTGARRKPTFLFVRRAGP